MCIVRVFEQEEEGSLCLSAEKRPRLEGIVSPYNYVRSIGFIDLKDKGRLDKEHTEWYESLAQRKIYDCLLYILKGMMSMDCKEQVCDMISALLAQQSVIIQANVECKSSVPILYKVIKSLDDITFESHKKRREDPITQDLLLLNSKLKSIVLKTNEKFFA